jgi:dUTP pyrophosphatase
LSILGKIEDNFMDKSLNVKVKRLDPNAKIPVRSSETAAGVDLYVLLDEPVTVAPGETVFFNTGIAVEIPVGYAGFIFARSSLGTKVGLAPANKVGVIDSDYRGEIRVALHNHSKNDAVVEPYQRIAQLVIMPVLAAEFIETDELSDTQRGEGGFGSTGK